MVVEAVATSVALIAMFCIPIYYQIALGTLIRIDRLNLRKRHFIMLESLMIYERICWVSDCGKGSEK